MNGLRHTTDEVLDKVRAERLHQKLLFDLAHDAAHEDFEWLGLIVQYAASGQQIKAAALCVAWAELTEDPS